MQQEEYVRFPYDVRWARENDWKPAMMMVWQTFMQFEAQDYTQEGIRHFFEFITDDDVYQAFLNKTYRMLVCVDGEKIIGVATLRSGNVLSLLFVDEAYHRQKVGTVLLELLCRYLQTEQEEHFLVVNAAPYAVPFYQSCGFRILEPEQNKSGIRVTKMEKILQA